MTVSPSGPKKNALVFDWEPSVTAGRPHRRRHRARAARQRERCDHHRRQVVQPEHRRGPGTAEELDRFGSNTALVDANGDKKDGLVVGDWAENANNGAAWVFPATSSCITASSSFSFGPSTMGLPATAALFGASIAG
ncbi:FG-GAP repeat protein [Streptomyces sp. TLI_185]|uniref:FG-GAP repeat protein n=1 Tax=Streptomyces sp. TLI_185 TaxID=2485151 RepID=UPI000F4FC619|nr:FG-GAP repeat protein [Streptomyces sp. TLI_185]